MNAAVGNGAVAAPRAGRRLRELAAQLRRWPARLPRAAWACALVMLANGLAWSLITPPFEVPDENAHYGYVAQIAERGTVPRIVQPQAQLSPLEDFTLGSVLFYEIVGERSNPSPMSELQQRTVEEFERSHLSRVGDGDALSATNNPPLYYALEAIPYKLASSGSVLDRLALMRVLSALMGAVTVLLVYLFLSELLPGSRWAWSAGALVVAFQPLFGFMSGGVNNDNLLFLTASGVLWGLARSFRRGLTPANGALIGGFLGAGIVTKLTMLGFVPAAALGVLIALRRSWSGARAPAVRGACWAFALGAAPFALDVLLNYLVWNRGAVPGGVGSVSTAPGVPALAFSFRDELGPHLAAVPALDRDARPVHLRAAVENLVQGLHRQVRLAGLQIQLPLLPRGARRLARGPRAGPGRARAQAPRVRSPHRGVRRSTCWPCSACSSRSVCSPTA